MKLNGYYICTKDGNPISGPYQWVTQPAELIDSLEHREEFHNASRYDLATRGRFPNTREGNEALLSVISSNIQLLESILYPTGKTLDVKRCARCGKDHEGLNVHTLTRPVLSTHWAFCPETWEPIWIVYADEREWGAPGVEPAEDLISTIRRVRDVVLGSTREEE